MLWAIGTIVDEQLPLIQLLDFGMEENSYSCLLVSDLFGGGAFLLSIHKGCLRIPKLEVGSEFKKVAKKYFKKYSKKCSKKYLTGKVLKKVVLKVLKKVLKGQFCSKKYF